MESWRKELYSSELYHHGIKDMKWGIRRYQNYDGSLTELGKRRREMADKSAKWSPRKEVANDYNLASNAAESTSRSASRASQVLSRNASNAREKAAKRIDLSSMTNDELQAAITRASLERQYSSLMSKDVGKGREIAADILQTTGDIVAILGGIAGIGVAINQFRR